MDDYEAKQHNNAIQERAITQLQDKERQAQEKRQRSRQIINSIADGLSAISNIVTTAHGAPDLGIGKTLLTQKSQERYDKLQKTAEDRRKDYLKIVQGGNRKELEDWLEMEKNKREQANEEREIAVKEERTKKDAMKAEAQALYYANKADREKWLALNAAAEAGDYEEFARLKKGLLQSQIDENEAQADRANRGGSGGSGNNKRKGFISIVKNDYKKEGWKNIKVGSQTVKLYEGTPEFDEYMRNHPDEARKYYGSNSQGESKDESKTIPGKRSNSKSKDNSKTIPGKRK